MNVYVFGHDTIRIYINSDSESEAWMILQDELAKLPNIREGVQIVLPDWRDFEIVSSF